MYDALDCAPGTDDVVIVNGLVGATTALMATLALAFLVLSAELVAVTVTVVFDVTEGAVNMPLPEIVPAEADHVTAVLLEPCTVATNCCPVPDFTDADVGETETLTVGAAAGTTLTTELALFVLSTELVARTVTEVVAETVGAVNMPALEILPAEADQVTAVLLVPCTLAVNCRLPPAVTLVLVGETEMLTLGWAVPATEICSCSVAAMSRASLTTIHPELVPAAVGVPLTAPVFGFSARPFGKLPETRM